MNVTSDIRRVFEELHDELLRSAIRLLADEQESRDVVGEVFAQLAERSLDGSEGSIQIRSYLFAAVRNRCLNLLRHKRLAERVHRLLPIGEEEAEEQQTDEAEDMLTQILDFVDTELTPRTREVVQLRFHEQMSYREIAARLGISEAAVYKHLAQGIRRLKARFNP